MTETSHEQATTEGKVVLVTGASSGIGEATALLLAQNRARLVLGARGQQRLDALDRRIKSKGGEVAHRITDLRRRRTLPLLSSWRSWLMFGVVRAMGLEREVRLRIRTLPSQLT